MRACCLCICALMRACCRHTCAFPDFVDCVCVQPLANGGRLPLHVALENKADARVVKALLEVHPAAARMACKKICYTDVRAKVCSRVPLACVCVRARCIYVICKAAYNIRTYFISISNDYEVSIVPSFYLYIYSFLHLSAYTMRCHTHTHTHIGHEVSFKIVSDPLR